MNFPTSAVEIVKTWIASPRIQAKYGNLAAYESACHYRNDPKLRQEFRSFQAYDAYIRAEAAGKVKIIH